MTLRDYLTVLRRKWPVVIVCGLMAAAVVWLLTPAKPPAPKPESYSATATLLVQAPPSDKDGTRPDVSLSRLALFVKTGQIPVLAARQLGYAGDPAVLAATISVEEDEAAMALKVSSTGADGARVTAVVNAFADQSVKYFDQDRPGSGGASLSVLQQATPIPHGEGPSYVLPPDRRTRVALAGLLGLVIGFGIGLVLHQFDSRIRTREDVYAAMALPIVAEVPRLSKWKQRRNPVIVATDALSPSADAYRAARAAVMHALSRQADEGGNGAGTASPGRGAPAVLVTSGHAKEGKTACTVNLAASFVESGKRVLVLDADLRAPDTHNQFDVPQGAGISDYLLQPLGPPLEALVRPTRIPEVGIITAGTALANPTALASRMGRLVTEARHLCDVLIIDSAPLLEASDVFDLLPMVDTVLIVVRSGRLREAAAQRVAELLVRFHVPVSGVVLVAVRRKRSAGYGYGYGYGKGPRGATRSSVRDESIPTPDAQLTRRARRAAKG